MDVAPDPLAGRTAAVTGAAGGIGQAVVRSLAEAGARVAALDLRAEDLATFVDEMQSGGANVVAVACDVTDQDSVSAAAATVGQALGPCDILVNNAAVLSQVPFMMASLEHVQRVVDVNLYGYLRCAKTFSAQMVQSGRGGSIVHVSSVGGSNPQPNGGAYSISKAGVNMLSRVLAQELGPYGIRSNVVSPALLVTPFSAHVYADPDVKRAREELVPLGRIGEAKDTARVVRFLAGDESTYVTGQNVAVDGGLAQVWMRAIPTPGPVRSPGAG